MAHVYAGVLGLLAFLTSLARGVLHGGGIESVLRHAWLSLLVFSVVGYVVGWVAGRTIDDAVRDHIAAELSDQEQEVKAPRAAAQGTTT